MKKNFLKNFVEFITGVLHKKPLLLICIAAHFKYLLSINEWNNQKNDVTAIDQNK